MPNSKLASFSVATDAFHPCVARVVTSASPDSRLSVKSLTLVTSVAPVDPAVPRSSFASRPSTIAIRKTPGILWFYTVFPQLRQLRKNFNKRRSHERSFRVFTSAVHTAEFVRRHRYSDEG